MILEGFEIENWSCIKKVRVTGLPPTGVIVLHGPNRRGKSSIVQALRACLLDYSSTTTALKSCYPRGTGEKPVVSVMFRAGGKSYRIKKHFGSNKSELASKTSTGDWKVETATAAEAHDRTCGLAGGTDSSKGLHQLLWLTQAEFRLPEARKFDAHVQAQLRSVLGVLQTPLDDRFIERVKKRWNVWYSGQRKADKQQKIKEGSKLAENLAHLQASQQELKETEGKFCEVEGLLRQAADLELIKLDLDQQLGERTLELTERKEEHRTSQARILARQQAEKDHTSAEKERDTALEEQSQRADVQKRWLDDNRAIEPAQTKAAAQGLNVKTMEEKQAQQRKDLGVQREKQRGLQERANRVAAKLRAMDDADKLVAAQTDLNRAQGIADEIDLIEKYLSTNPAPDETSLAALKANRKKVAKLTADRDAASMNLTLAPEHGAGAAQLALDSGPLLELPIASPPIGHTVRRKAELLIVGWGRIEISRGTGSGDLDQIENELRRCNDEFASAVTPLGISANDPDALEQLLQRQAAHQLKNPVLKDHKRDLKKLAPKGLDPLKTKVAELQAKLKDVPGAEPGDSEPLPSERSELDKLTVNLQEQLAIVDANIETLEQAAQAVETTLDEARQDETNAREALAACKAKADSRREELDRLRTDEQISQRIKDAQRTVENAQTQLKQTALTTEESTIEGRLAAVEDAVAALHSQIGENIRKYDVIKGRLFESEGLHARRASLAAKVDELTHLTDRESLEKDAVDRLYSLFEECREKQLGALMGPIHDRVLGWMRVLDIGDYQELRFNDAFLPDKLMSRDGTAEFTMDEESTGAQEQIGMLVRVALGSTLASVSEPAVAVLDDPLTHCDIGRLNKMRVILRRAAEGDPQLTPPAGPLQIVILTCHPEWFRDERATVIDLESPDVMSRWAV